MHYKCTHLLQSNKRTLISFFYAYFISSRVLVNYITTGVVCCILLALRLSGGLAWVCIDEHTHTHLYHYYYTAAQLMPVATTQEHTQLAETVLHAQNCLFVSILRANKLFAPPNCGRTHCEDDCIDKSSALGFWTVQTFVKP